LPTFYQKVSILDNKFIVCENPNKIPNTKITKELCIFYIRKNVEYQDVLQFKNKTNEIIKDKNYTRILIVIDVSESMKDFIVSQNIDYIHYNFQTKKWVTSWKRTEKYREEKEQQSVSPNIQQKFNQVRKKVFKK
jgi:hypothetical protein